MACGSGGTSCCISGTEYQNRDATQADDAFSRRVDRHLVDLRHNTTHIGPGPECVPRGQREAHSCTHPRWDRGTAARTCSGACWINRFVGVPNSRTAPSDFGMLARRNDCGRCRPLQSNHRPFRMAGSRSDRRPVYSSRALIAPLMPSCESEPTKVAPHELCRVSLRRLCPDRLGLEVQSSMPASRR